MNTIEYDLSFEDAINKVFDEDVKVQGENFKDGYYIAKNPMQGDYLEVRRLDLENDVEWPIGNLHVTINVVRQKYRVVTTNDEIMRKN